MFTLLRRSFARDTHGNVSQMFALAIIPVLAAIGGAVDFAMVSRMKTDAQHSLDSAVLAAAQTARTTPQGNTQYKKDGTEFFKADFLPSDPATLKALDFSRKFGTDGSQTVGGEADIAVPTFFLGLVNIKSWDAKVTSETRISPPVRFEISLVIDITGSMSFYRNVEPLKEAAKSFIDILFESKTKLDKSWIGIVPYSQSVNLGRYVKKASSNYMTQDGRILPTDNADYVADPIGRRQNVVERSGAAATTDAAPTTSNKYQLADDRNTQYKEAPYMKILGPTDQKAPLVNTINSIQTGGGTAGHMGFQWGLNMVSPKWSHVWNAPSGTSPYTGPSAKKKFIVMMTDGEFNHSPGRRTGPGPGTSDVNGTFDKLCTFAKKQGVIVYTIAFKAPPAAEKVMKKCASPGKHIDAKSKQALIDAFESIAADIQSFYLSG